MPNSEQLKRVDILTGSFPKTVDINPTAKCNLACRFCWGPDHHIPDGLSTDRWKGVIDFFADRGTDSIVLTGGEPLVRRDIGTLMQHAHERGMRVTLSTNTLLLKEKADTVLPFIDRIGIPIDGSNRANHARMRVGHQENGARSFDTAVEALGLIQQVKPGMYVSIRTVVSGVNRDDVPHIGSVIAGEPFNQWILYQFTPVSIGAGSIDEHTISDSDFTSVAAQTQALNPTLPIVPYLSADRTGRYVFVGPQGDLFGVGQDGQYSVQGNFLTDNTLQLERAVKTLFDPSQNAIRTDNQ